jgi:hypothetical protein
MTLPGEGFKFSDKSTTNGTMRQFKLMRIFSNGNLRFGDREGDLSATVRAHIVR